MIANTQIVIAFKGSTRDRYGINFYNDLTNAGGADYTKLSNVFSSVLTYLKTEYPSEQIFTDGHSLGGGLAQTFSLQYGLSGFGQNSLAISASALGFLESGTPTALTPGEGAGLSTLLSNYRNGTTGPYAHESSQFIEHLNEHWFTSLLHARAVIRAWTQEYNEERPKKKLGGLTPAAYARTLAVKAATINPGL